jgi:hypothetical protein
MAKKLTDFTEKMCETLTDCLSVQSLRGILDELCKEGYGELKIAFRLGHTKDDKSVNFPIADIRYIPNTAFLLTSFPRGEKNDDGTYKPKFDCLITIQKDSLKLEFDEP